MSALLALRTWASKSDLVDHLGGCDARTLVVGLDTEAPRAYHSFFVASDYGKREVGVITSGLGVDAAAVVIDGGRRVLVGHDAWVTCVDVEALAVLTRQRLGGVFFDFVAVDGDEEIVIIHELGALRVDGDGAVKWSVDTDVVEDSTTDANGNLILNVADGLRLVVSLASGRILR